MTAALTFQVMLVGDSGVGKTCLLVRFKDGAFLAGSFISTVGIDFRSTMILASSLRKEGRLESWQSNRSAISISPLARDEALLTMQSVGYVSSTTPMLALAGAG
ncbi:unnamed protein product [Arctogadus glacialis]